MGEAFISRRGGGGAGLNFSVKAYSSKFALPSVEKENTIAVITDAEITSWMFSATVPEYPSEGMVWISTGTSSVVEFNALKKNVLQVYPTSAMQYYDGAFHDVFAYCYQDGSWVQFSEVITSLYLYKEGDECTDITGGWNGTKGSNYLSFGGTTSSSGTVTSVSTKSAFSCDGYTQMVVDFELTNVHGSVNGNFGFTLPSSSAKATFATKNVTVNKRQTASIDVSSVTGTVTFNTTAYYATVKIYNVYLLP